MANRFALSFAPEDFSIDLCVNCGQVFRWKRVEAGRWIGVDGKHWYDVFQQSSTELTVESNGTKQDFERLFRFDWSGPTIRNEIVARGNELAPFVEQLPGLRLMRPSSAHETFFCFLCTPNNHLSRITAMIDVFGGYGTSFHSRPDLTCFPDVEVIASIPEMELRNRGFGYRGASIPKAAQQILDLGGEEYLDSLRGAGYAKAHAKLCSIHGVGPKLADCIALYGLDETRAVPIDTHVWQAAVRLYFPEWADSALTLAKYREVVAFFQDRFGELSGWAHQYLFFDNVLHWRARKADRSKRV